MSKLADAHEQDPFQMIEFNLILSTVQPNISSLMFSRLFIGTVIMLASGYAGEANFVNAWLGSIVGMAGWGPTFCDNFLRRGGLRRRKR